jgi:deoxyribonuclease-4
MKKEYCSSPFAGIRFASGVNQMLLGAHLSITGGVDTAFGRAEALGCTTFQIFTKSNRQWNAKKLEPTVIKRYHSRQNETGISPVVCHASYLLNLGSPDDALWNKSIDALGDELIRCEQLKIPYLVLHPGAHLKSGVEAGLARVTSGLDQVHERQPDCHVQIALELTAGAGTTLGHTFEHLAQIITRCQQPERLVTCFDSCHAFAAGYEFRTPASYQRLMADFEQTIGLERLRVFHLNDSLKGLGHRVDRHTHIGAGVIGLEPFGYFLNDPRFQDRPFLLETPKDDDPNDDLRNLQKLRDLIQ